MSTIVILTAAQLIVLHTAAQRPDHMVLPPPPTLRARGASLRQLLASLLKAALVEEHPVNDGTLSWRQGKSGQRFGLRLTAKGLAAVAKEEPLQPPVSDAAAQPDCPPVEVPITSEPKPPVGLQARPRPNGKLGLVLNAISADSGASLAELVEMRGWQPHTTRAALTGLRQRGYAVELATQDGRKAYRLAAEN